MYYSGMDTSGRILELRALLEARGLACGMRGGTVPGAWETGLPWMDDPGLLPGSVTELVAARPGTGTASVVRHLLTAAPARGGRLALVDAADAFDPESCRGLDVSRLLWVRCGTAGRALQAADLLLRDGSTPLVVLDLVGCGVKELRGLPGAAWFRLRGLAERGGGCALVVTPCALVAGVRVRVVLDRAWPLDAVAGDAAEWIRSLSPRVERRTGGAATFA
jgi:hypothetical protein